MPRPLDYRVRGQILMNTVDYIDLDGLANVSLRPLGIATSVSSRMLIHYFGTKEDLLRQALASVRPDYTALFADVCDRTSLGAALRALWVSMTGGDDGRGSRVLVQLLGIACVPGPYSDYAAEVVRATTDTVAAACGRAGFADEEARARAAALLSGLRGLLADRLVTGDAAGADRAADTLIAAIAG